VHQETFLLTTRGLCRPFEGSTWSPPVYGAFILLAAAVHGGPSPGVSSLASMIRPLSYKYAPSSHSVFFFSQPQEVHAQTLISLERSLPRPPSRVLLDPGDERLTKYRLPPPCDPTFSSSANSVFYSEKVYDVLTLRPQANFRKPPLARSISIFFCVLYQQLSPQVFRLVPLLSCVSTRMK